MTQQYSFLHLVSSNPPAREIMKTKLITLSPDTEVFKAVEVLIKNRISGAPVVDEEGNLVGTFSEKCVMKVLVDAGYEQIPTSSIDRVMHKDPYTIEESTQLLSIAQIFLTTECRRLPVLKKGKLVGQISRRDVVGAALKMVQKQTPTASNDEKHLLYLSALREMSDAPNV